MFKNRKDAEEKLKLWGNVNTIIANKARSYLKDNPAPVVEEVPVEVIVEVPHKGLTVDELYALTKDEQVDMLEKLGETKIPRFEKGRVEKIYALLQA